MNIADYLEKWGRTILEAPLTSRPNPEEPPELAEIRLAVLDQVREKSYRSGGRKVFPYDLLRIELRGVEQSRSSVFAGAFFRKYLEGEVRSALASAGCRYPEGLRVSVEATPGLPKPGEPWLVVEPSVAEQPGGATQCARLIVREGAANVPELRLEKARTNIGRSIDVIRAEGLFRRNDLAFAEDTEINRSVSREHAHILRDKAACEYRLFNDRWYPLGSHDCGTWIVRNGMSQEVHRDSRGTRLEPGDEIHFGRAIVMFEE
ncbi:MAG: FHA domain-containing protein [Acidobacteriia bacterium]|nr:FHA domain-containing protein [Terriglobia bacterium]MBV8906024.1 FHA domain-containing protein [Terriglobia bacterium]MBV9743301.1 FHA domain-containing protein [Terriglobia bacterium]